MPIVDVDGARVEYDRIGGGPDLLLLHSLLTELTVFDGVLPQLAARFRVTRINLPGFGATAPLTLDTVADWADQVARTMNALELSAPTDIFGNGFGAFVALELAVRHGARFRRLVVADTAPAFPESAKSPFRAMAEKVRASGMAAVLDTAIGRMLQPAFQAAHPDVVAERKRRLASTDPESFARACLALATLDLRPNLGRIRKPTLVLCGALDQTTPPALGEAVADAIPGAVYRAIPDSGHCPMLEQPAALVSFIEQFAGTVAD